jgi:hypothetical protein
MGNSTFVHGLLMNTTISIIANISGGGWTTNGSLNTTTYLPAYANSSISANNHLMSISGAGLGGGQTPLTEAHFYDMDLAPIAYRNISALPTISTADSNVPSEMNFATSATILASGGLVVAGSCPATNLAILNASKLNVFAVKMKLLSASSGMYNMIGLFKTSSSLVIYPTGATGIFFYMNASNSSLPSSTGANAENWTVYGCVSAGSCTSVTTNVTNDTAWHTFTIEGNGRYNNSISSNYTFYIDNNLVGSISANLPTSMVSTAGTWVENGDTVADTQVIDWIYYEAKR